MFKEITFALYAIKKNIQNSTELRMSFLLTVIGMAINNGAFIATWIFFTQSVGEINGWQIADVVSLNGFVAVSYGIMFSLFVGIRRLPQYISDGVFDRFLLSPKSVLVRVATSSFHASAVGDVLFGLICFGAYIYMVGITMPQFLLSILLLCNAIGMFFAVSVIAYSAGFYFTDGFSVTYSIFDLFMTPTLFHGGIFHGVMRFVFTFVVPSLVVGALPAEILKSVSFFHAMQLTGVVCLWICGALLFFHRSVKRYESANFMTFGR